nr:zinc finger protein JAGGED isoform X2 [Malus domestica]
MRPDEGNPLDLNNLPEDHYGRDGQQVADVSSSGSYRKKKNGAKDGKDESGKVYECRFCSLKFCKSQALGGHMNRHRQERETEQLNRARRLVFNNDNLAAPPPHLGSIIIRLLQVTTLVVLIQHYLSDFHQECFLPLHQTPLYHRHCHRS